VADIIALILSGPCGTTVKSSVLIGPAYHASVLLIAVLLFVENYIHIFVTPVRFAPVKFITRYDSGLIVKFVVMFDCPYGDIVRFPDSVALTIVVLLYGVVFSVAGIIGASRIMARSKKKSSDYFLSQVFPRDQVDNRYNCCCDYNNG